MDTTKSLKNPTGTNPNRQERKCVICRLDCVCEIVDYYDKHRNSDNIVDEKPVCDRCCKLWTSHYNDVINEDKLDITLMHYSDLKYLTELKKFPFMANSCMHYDNELLRKNLMNVVSDYEHCIRQKSYTPKLETESQRVRFLKSQGYVILDLRKKADDIKYQITMPEGRKKNTRTEANATDSLNGSLEPVITDFDTRSFLLHKVSFLKETE